MYSVRYSQLFTNRRKNTKGKRTTPRALWVDYFTNDRFCRFSRVSRTVYVMYTKIEFSIKEKFNFRVLIFFFLDVDVKLLAIFFFVIFGLRDITVQHNRLQFSLSNDITFQSSPGLTLSTSSLILSSHRNLGRPSGLLPCGAFSSTQQRSLLTPCVSCPRESYHGDVFHNTRGVGSIDIILLVLYFFELSIL